VSATSTVQYATSDGAAHAPGDYTASSGIFTFNPGETSKTFSVPVIDNLVFEGNKTVNLTLSNPTGAALGGQSTAVLTIIENDVPPTAYVVNTTDDVNFCNAVTCSLRGAIVAANAHPGRDFIAFNIPGAGVHTITLASFL